MTRFDGYDITYDAIGNPLIYHSAWNYSFSWSGRELMGATVDGISYSFSYNADGLRATKEGGGNYITYYYEGNRLIGESCLRYYDPITARFISPDDLSYLGANGDLNSSKYAIKNSGAHESVVIEFKSNAAFLTYPGIQDPKVLAYGPVRTSGTITVWDVKIVR